LIHLICGSTGAGKTTYAQALANEVDGFVFSIDKWMMTLFGDDTPEELTPAWFMPRVERCEEHIRSQIIRLADLNVPSILDLGFQRKDHRNSYYTFAGEHSLAVKLHVLDVPVAVRWGRVERRNASPDRDGSLKVAPIGWSGLSVSASLASGPLGRCFLARVVDTPMSYAA
jgi:predicted kinase